MLLKFVILAISVSIGALAAPGWYPNLSEMEIPSWVYDVSLPTTEGNPGSSHGSVPQAYHDSFSATGKVPGLYKYEPSRNYERRPKEKRTNDDHHEFYGDLVDQVDKLDKDWLYEYEPRWEHRFNQEQWEHMYAKCFDGLEAIGWDGSKADQLLKNYGCNSMAETLLLDDAHYEKVVARALLRRRQDHLRLLREFREMQQEV